jgi:hypothetical protein
MPKIEMTVTDAEARQIAEAQAAGIPVRVQIGDAPPPREVFTPRGMATEETANYGVYVSGPMRGRFFVKGDNERRMIRREEVPRGIREELESTLRIPIAPRGRAGNPARGAKNQHRAAERAVYIQNLDNDAQRAGNLFQAAAVGIKGAYGSAVAEKLLGDLPRDRKVLSVRYRQEADSLRKVATEWEALTHTRSPRGAIPAEEIRLELPSFVGIFNSTARAVYGMLKAYGLFDLANALEAVRAVSADDVETARDADRATHEIAGLFWFPDDGRYRDPDHGWMAYVLRSLSIAAHQLSGMYGKEVPPAQNQRVYIAYMAYALTLMHLSYLSLRREVGISETHQRLPLGDNWLHFTQVLHQSKYT